MGISDIMIGQASRYLSNERISAMRINYGGWEGIPRFDDAVGIEVSPGIIYLIRGVSIIEIIDPGCEMELENWARSVNPNALWHKNNIVADNKVAEEASVLERINLQFSLSYMPSMKGLL